MRVTGPLLWEQPFGEVELPPGDEPLVLVAPSTSQDPDAADAAGGAGRPRRRAGARDRDHQPPATCRAAASAAATRGVVDWLSYARTMPRCAAVVCHAGHGTVARALACGVPVVGVARRGRHGGERRARGVGGRGRVAAAAAVTPRGVRLAVRRVLGDPAYGATSAELASWVERHDPAVAADSGWGDSRPLGG